MTKLNFIKDEWSDRVHKMSKYKMFCATKLQFRMDTDYQPIQGAVAVSERTTNFREGDKVSGLYFIQQGKVKIVSNGLNGKEQIVRLVSDGYVIGHCGIGEEMYPIGAVALKILQLAFLSNELLKALIERMYNLHLHSCFIILLSCAKWKPD